MASVGGIYLNLGLWALSVAPAWVVVRKFGESGEDKKVERERRLAARE